MIALGCMFAFTACSKQTDQKPEKETTAFRTKDIKRPINTSQKKENTEVTIDQKQEKRQRCFYTSKTECCRSNNDRSSDRNEKG